jgi:hypothetical protein
LFFVELTHISGPDIMVNFCNIAFIEEELNSTLIQFKESENRIRVVDKYQDIQFILESLS